jgi:hypothetical protein
VIKRYLIIASLITTGCEPSIPDLKESLLGWEYVTTFKVLPSKQITVFEKQSEIVDGNNNVFIITSEVRPIFKPGKHLTDLHSYRSILIELSNNDSIVTPMNLGRSHIYREVLAMSPQYGTNNLDPTEKITIARTALNRWAVDADLYDLQFEGTFSLTDSMAISNTRKQMYD